MVEELSGDDEWMNAFLLPYMRYKDGPPPEQRPRTPLYDPNLPTFSYPIYGDGLVPNRNYETQRKNLYFHPYNSPLPGFRGGGYWSNDYSPFPWTGNQEESSEEETPNPPNAQNEQPVNADEGEEEAVENQDGRLHEQPLLFQQPRENADGRRHEQPLHLQEEIENAESAERSVSPKNPIASNDGLNDLDNDRVASESPGIILLTDDDDEDGDEANAMKFSDKDQVWSWKTLKSKFAEVDSDAKSIDKKEEIVEDGPPDKETPKAGYQRYLDEFKEFQSARDKARDENPSVSNVRKYGEKMSTHREDIQDYLLWQVNRKRPGTVDKEDSSSKKPANRNLSS